MTVCIEMACPKCGEALRVPVRLWEEGQDGGTIIAFAEFSEASDDVVVVADVDAVEHTCT